MKCLKEDDYHVQPQSEKAAYLHGQKVERNRVHRSMYKSDKTHHIQLTKMRTRCVTAWNGECHFKYIVYQNVIISFQQIL